MSENTDFYFQWHITDVCNNRCKHCYHENYDNARELGIEQLRQIAWAINDALGKWGFAGNASLTGGEPFTRRGDLFQLLEYVEKECPNLSGYDILTNGTLLTDEDMARLKCFAKLRRIQVSLEGSSEDLHDSVRGDGDYAKVVNAIKKLKKNGFSVSVMTTVTKNNKQDIPKLISLLGRLDVDYFALERFMPEGQGEQHKGWVLDALETKEIFEYMTRKAFQITKPCLLLYRTLYCLCGTDETVGAMCSAGVNALTILPDATILPCRRLPIPIGNVLTNGIIDTWYNSDVLWRLRDYSSYKGKCNGCEHFTECRGCRSMAYAATGDYMQEDPQCWK